MNLARGPFEKIASGAKTIESRLFDEKRRKIHVGDTIEFACASEPHRIIRVRVVAVHPFKKFEELFSSFPPARFGGVSPEELLTEIRAFYSESDERRWGVVGIEIELMK